MEDRCWEVGKMCSHGKGNNEGEGSESKRKESRYIMYKYKILMMNLINMYDEYVQIRNKVKSKLSKQNNKEQKKLFNRVDKVNNIKLSDRQSVFKDKLTDPWLVKSQPCLDPVSSPLGAFLR